MAQTRTSSSGRGSGTKKKPVSTARKTSGTKKTSSSSRSGSTKSRSQTKKAPARSAASRSGSAKTQSRSGSAQSRPSRQPARSQPIRREVGCFVLLFLGLVTAIAYFPVEGWLVDNFRTLFQGLFGWGFYLVPVCLLWGAGILGFHRGRPVRLRLACVLLMPLVFGAFIQLIWYKNDNLFISSFSSGIASLWDSAQYTVERCGGVLGGTVGIGLKKSLGMVGGAILCVLAAIFMLLGGLNLSVVAIIDWIQTRPRLVYEPKPVDELDEEQYFSPDDYLFPLDGGEPIRKKKQPANTESERYTGPVFFDQDRPGGKKADRGIDSKQRLERAKDILFADFDVEPPAQTRPAKKPKKQEPAPVTPKQDFVK